MSKTSFIQKKNKVISVHWIEVNLQHDDDMMREKEWKKKAKVKQRPPAI